MKRIVYPTLLAAQRAHPNMAYKAKWDGNTLVWVVTGKVDR